MSDGSASWDKWYMSRCSGMGTSLQIAHSNNNSVGNSVTTYEHDESATHKGYAADVSTSQASNMSHTLSHEGSCMCLPACDCLQERCLSTAILSNETISATNGELNAAVLDEFITTDAQ